MHENDVPISSSRDDTLERAHFASTIAKEIRSFNASEGVVVGILGPWGSGKTSLINLVKEALEKSSEIPVVEFNPWLFSGTDELVDFFFAELAAQLRLKDDQLSVIADELERYADIVAPLQILPVVGSWIERVSGAAQALKKLRSKGKGGVNAARDTLRTNLSELKHPVLIVIDDIDRLSTDEIREIFKLVRLTANFPNLIYLLAFDRKRVEQALREVGISGRDYLEKIIQINYDVPEVPSLLLGTQLFAALDNVLARQEISYEVDQDRWPDVYLKVVNPLVRNMRDVRRYAASLGAVLHDLEGRVDIVDVLAVEAIRVFLPDVFTALTVTQSALTKPENTAWVTQRDDSASEEAIKKLLVVEIERQPVIQQLIVRVFPNAARFLPNNYIAGETLDTLLKQRRLGHPDVLQFYLERVAPPGLNTHWAAEQAYALLSDSEGLDAYLKSHRREDWANIIHALEAYEREFPLTAITPASTVLLNIWPEMPKRERAVLDLFDEELIVTRVVLQLLKRQEGDGSAVESRVREILPKLNSLSAKLQLLSIVGHESGRGHQLVSLEFSDEVERQLRDEIRASTDEVLAGEHDLFRLLTWATRSNKDDEPAIDISTTPPLGPAILKSALTEERSQIVGSRAIKREPRLYWSSLVQLVGGESRIQELLDHSSNIEGDERLDLARGLAEKYLSGWDPDSDRSRPTSDPHPDYD